MPEITPVHGLTIPPGGDTSLISAALRAALLGIDARLTRDTGWRALDITTVAGSIRDAATPGTLHIRRTGSRVTVRLLGVGMAAGSGAGFLLPNNIPTGLEARNTVGPVVCAELGDTSSTQNRHRVHVSSNDLYWCGWSSSTGVYSTTHPTDRTLQGEVSWHTDDAWPLTIPGTPV